MITTHDYCFIACCKDFLRTIIKIRGLKKLNQQLLLSWGFFSFGDVDVGDDSACLNMNFDEQNDNYFCSCF